MNKRYLHHWWTRLRRVSSLGLFIATILCGLLAFYALRQNNLTALRLRDEVLKVDKANGDIEKALGELRSYMHGHMNAGLAAPNAAYPPIQLKYRYERLVSAEKKRVSKINSGLYTEAQQHCERLHPDAADGASRVICNQDYVNKRAVKEKSIPDSLYKFDFASPLWSPDLAGLAVIATMMFGTLLVIRLILAFWFRRMLQ